ncbi:MAG: DUF169 domain-containing protein [Methanophagales archaeon]|nr:DUF169 domain-containing protein [Methanophagales archaeon]
MQEQEKFKKLDYADAQAKLMSILELRYPPVAVSLIRHKALIPEGVQELEKPMFYCAMVKYAMLGNLFYAREALHACKRGGAALGLCEIPEEEETGAFYVNKASCSCLRAAWRFVNASLNLKPGSIYATLLAPLAKTPVEPDVILIEAIPRRAFELIHATLYDIGGSTESWISPPRQVCAYATVRPYLSGELNLTIACESARMVAREVGCEYLDETVLVGLPAEMLLRVIENLPRIGYVKARLGKSEGRS